MSKQQPLDHNRGIVNQQHYEDTRDISPLEENNDSIDRTNDTPTRTINESENTDKPPSPASKVMGAEDPFWTEGWQNKGWLCTGSLFLVTFSVFGILFCWGVFQPYYLDHVYPGQTDVFRIAFIGTSAQCLTTLLGLPLSWVIRCIGYKGTMAIGMLLFPASLILASFATQLWHVLMTQGILLGIGAAFCFSPSFMLPSQWFVRHRSLANGIGNTGSCVGALCLSPLAQHLIETLGYRNALRVLGAIVFAILSLATLLARARYPPSSSTPTIMQKSSNITSLRSSPLFSTPFALGLIFSLLVPFGYVVPFYLMPTYAMQQVGASASMGAALVSIGMATGVVSRLGSGFIGDRIGPINTLSILTLTSGIYILLMHCNIYANTIVYPSTVAILIMVLWTFSHTVPLYGI